MEKWVFMFFFIRLSVVQFFRAGSFVYFETLGHTKEYICKGGVALIHISTVRDSNVYNIENVVETHTTL